MTAGGSPRASSSAKSSFASASFAILALSKVLANLAAAARGAPQAS
jgi:hypothetical protein